MNTTLDALIKLQKIDLSIMDIRQKIDEFPEIMRQLDKQLQESDEKVAELQNNIDEQEKLRRSKERGIEMQNEQIKKYQTQLLQVKTNKEYSALLMEIKSAKSKNSLTEDDIIELMESVERAKEALIHSRKELQLANGRIEEERQRQESALKELQASLQKEEDGRTTLAEKVDDVTLREYTRLLKVRHGMAVAATEDGGVCTGCHVAVTPQMFTEIKSGQYLHRCPICFRFLYWKGSQEE